MIDPIEVAKSIYSKMEQYERECVKDSACGDYEDYIRNQLGEGCRERDVVRCMDEIDRLCGYEIYLAG